MHPHRSGLFLLGGKRYSLFSASNNVDRRGSLIGKAVVLKTTAGNRLQVRVLSSPPDRFWILDFGFWITTLRFGGQFTSPSKVQSKIQSKIHSKIQSKSRPRSSPVQNPKSKIQNRARACLKFAF